MLVFKFCRFTINSKASEKVHSRFKSFMIYKNLRPFTVIDCPVIEAPTNGKMSCSRSFLLGSQCSIACDRGYELIGSNSRVCQTDRTWDTDKPLCIGKLSLNIPHRLGCDLSQWFLKWAQLRDPKRKIGQLQPNRTNFVTYPFLQYYNVLCTYYNVQLPKF